MNTEDLKLPREEYEPIVSQPIDLEFMEAEVSLSVSDINSSHEIRTCYGDICKIVNALRDYSRLLIMVCDTWNLLGFHRATYEHHAKKLREVADKFQAGIGYDYDAAVAQREKRKSKKQHDDDVGGEALAMGHLKAQQMAEAKARKEATLSPDSAPFVPKGTDEDDPWAEDD